jgi:hypothetical protein
MITIWLEKIQDPEWKAFAFRVYNTFKTIILPIVFSLVYLELQNNPGDISCLADVSFWVKVSYAVVTALVGAGIAGLDKVNRMKEE